MALNMGVYVWSWVQANEYGMGWGVASRQRGESPIGNGRGVTNVLCRRKWNCSYVLRNDAPLFALLHKYNGRPEWASL